MYEQVSHHPPITASFIEGQGWNYQKSYDAKVKFQGKNCVVTDNDHMYLTLFPTSLAGSEKKSERYIISQPKMMVGNVIIGEIYLEPFGSSTVVNHDTGESAEFEFRARKWNSKNHHFTTCTIKDSNGVEKYRIEGNYYESMHLINLETQEKLEMWQNPPKPENSNLMYHFNKFTLQLNYAPDELKSKLPPTDCRLRPDVRRWEEGLLKEASNEKNRMEVNQRLHKAELKNLLGSKIDPDDDGSYYHPKYFKRG